MHAEHLDVIVIGVGSMGSATCYNLAKRGARVMGIEQFTSPHEKGSHTGQSRIVRKAYFEHPDYVPLLNRSYELWRELEKEAATKLFHKTGIFYSGKPQSDLIAGMKLSAERYRIPIEKIESKSNRWRQFAMPPDFEMIHEPDAGFVSPEVAIATFIRQAEKAGAVIHQQETVTSWDYSDRIFSIKTTKGRYKAPRMVVTAGSWTSNLLPQVSEKLKVTEQFLFWVDVNDPREFSIENFPCWLIEDPEMGTFYGFPILPSAEFEGPAGLKIALHAPGEKSNPDHRFKKDPEQYFSKVNTAIAKYFPGVKGEILSCKPCLYTYSPDTHFIIDHLPGFDNNLSIACGFSGHGFKFVPVVGEILSSLAIEGKTDLPIDFLRLSRLSGSK
jgi:sarcosine oxidase